MKGGITEHSRPGLLDSWKYCTLFLTVYAVCLLLLVARLPLWLDELIDLHQIRDFDLPGLLTRVPINAGGVPLSYLFRELSVHLLGYSRFSGRLPSLLCCLAACVGIFVLAREIKLRIPLLAVVLFALTPVQLRYALESRPYSQELALSVWASVVFLVLTTRPAFAKAFLYALILVAGLYTQPYMIFVPLVHLLWVCSLKAGPDKRRLLLFTALPIAAAALAFLPWYLWAFHLWSGGAKAHQYGISLHIIPMILKELVGAGYFGTACALGPACVGFYQGMRNRDERTFWALYLLLPVLLAIFADKIFGYFFAVRQLITVLVPLSILAALGVERLLERNARVALPACALLLGSFVAGDIHLFSEPREDWQSASVILREKLAAPASCAIFAPPGSIDLYSFFDPHLAERACPSALLPFNVIIVAVSPYGSAASYSETQKRLSHDFGKSATLNSQRPRIEVYVRKRSH